MSEALLQTKLFIPPVRPGYIPRPRLLERLAQGLHRRLTLISAPAGFGKTALLGAWLTAPRDGPRVATAWLSLDKGDNDPARFLRYLVAALQNLAPGLGDGLLGALGGPQPSPLPALLTALINDLAQLSEPSVLVLDDYHLIEAQPVHQAVAFLLEHLPSHLHLALATRADPPLPLARLRAREDLTELRAAELRFTPEEAALFLNESRRLGLEAEQVVALATRTEGWVAGLQLAALSLDRTRQMAGASGVADSVASFAGDDRFVVDYLVEEVLAGLPAPKQTFLLHTSILTRLCGPLCDALMGTHARTPPAASHPQAPGPPGRAQVAFPASGQKILEQLEAANLFIEPLDQTREWYRYHQLFADLLRHRLQSSQPELLPLLHRRASEWYEHNGHLSQAIDHALAAPDHGRAAQLIARSFRPSFARGEMDTFLTHLEALPEEMVRGEPRLGLLSAWALMGRMQLDAIEPQLQQVERGIRARLETGGAGGSRPPVPSREEGALLLGEAATLRAVTSSLLGDAPRTVECAHEALALLPEGETFLRGTVVNTLGTAHEAVGELAAATKAFAQAIDLCQEAGNALVALIATSNLGRVRGMQGQLRASARVYHRALAYADSLEQGPVPVVGTSLVGLADLCYEWNDLEKAGQYLDRGLELGRKLGAVEIQVAGALSRARIQQARGSLDRALETLDRAKALAGQYGVSASTASSLEAYRARLWIAGDDLSRASRWAAAREPGDLPGLPSRPEPEQVVLARLLLARGRAERAVSMCARLLRTAEAQGRVGSAIELLVLLAAAQEAAHDRSAALISLDRAVSLAEPEGYVRTFLDEGASIAHLLRLSVAAGNESDHARRLLSAFPEPPPPAARGGPEPAQQGLVEPLSDRELEVLRAIARGSSNREIAERLYITVGTVKWHANNIYGKLGVRRRTEAAARARELGLL
jgi:LuxR family maltose regulon positive regulatory protein